MYSVLTARSLYLSSVCVYLSLPVGCSALYFFVSAVGLFVYCSWDGKYVKKRSLVSGLFDFMIKKIIEYPFFSLQGLFKSETDQMEVNGKRLSVYVNLTTIIQ